MTTTRMLRVRRTPTHTIAAYDTGSSFQIETWNLATDERALVDELHYAGQADRIATRAMARGAVDSLAQQIRAGAYEAR